MVNQDKVCTIVRSRDISGSPLAKSARCILVFVVLASAAVSTGHADEASNRDNVFQIIQWSGYDVVTELKDGTSLHGYVAEAKSFNATNSTRAEHNSTYRFTFHPRFQCSPLIVLAGVLPDNTGEDERVSTLINFNRIKVSIDGDAIDFPTLVERQENIVQGFYDASLQRRTTLRILTELGDVMRVEYGDSEIEEFSLIGSKKALGQAMARCKNH